MDFRVELSHQAKGDIASIYNWSDRLARFRREAQVLASLNHPYIAQIDGLDDAGGLRALVMELVEGPTLASYGLPRMSSRSDVPGLPIAVAAAVCRASALTKINSDSVMRAAKSCADAT